MIVISAVFSGYFIVVGKDIRQKRCEDLTCVLCTLSILQVKVESVLVYAINLTVLLINMVSIELENA